DADVEEEQLAIVPLDDPGPGGDLGPFRMQAKPEGAEVAMRVDFHPRAEVEEVQARVHPYAYGQDLERWVNLDRSHQAGGRRWTGQVDTSDLWPGPHKMEVRAVSPDGAVY